MSMVVKFTHQLGKKFPVSGINRAESKQLYPGLCVYLEKHSMEVWMPGQCVYAVVLADSEFQAIEERELVPRQSSLDKFSAIGCPDGKAPIEENEEGQRHC